MSNICSSTPVRNIEIRELQREFNLIRKNVCYLSGQVATTTTNTTISSASGNILTNNTGLYVPADTVQESSLTNLSTTLHPTGINGVWVPNVGMYTWTNVVLTDNGYTNIAAQGPQGGYWVLSNAATGNRLSKRSYFKMVEVKPGVVSGSLEAVTKNGAMSTATITNSGGYDQFAVTAGDNTSWIDFTSLTYQDNATILKARVKLVSVGVSAPMVGIGLSGHNLTNDTNSGAGCEDVMINLLTHVVQHRAGNNVTINPVTTKNSSALSFSNGDVIDIELFLEWDTSLIRFNVINTTNKSYSYSTVGGGGAGSLVRSRDVGYVSHSLKLILADGTYTLLSFEGYSSVPQNNLLALIGDSYACGDNIILNLNWPYLLQKALPQYDIACYAANGAYINSMVQYQLADVLRTRPKYVLIVSILTLFWGFFDDGNANQTEFDNGMAAIMDTVTGYGGIPILIKWQTTGGFINGNSAAWNTKIAALQASYPTTLVLDLSGQSLQLNNSSHPTTSDTIKMAKQTVELLKSVSAV